MRARAKRLPGQPGTKALLKIYGDKLVCVRYRYDEERRKRYKTAEIIVDEAPWEPPPPATPPPDTIVYLRIKYEETGLQAEVKKVGGRWRRDVKLWAIRYDQAAALALLDRMVDPSVQ
jgi:hypothetical protein